MKLQIVLLFVIIAADDVPSYLLITFRLKLLEPDLQAISQYHDKVSPLPAFVHWPNSITFSIESVKDCQTNEFYLKISGTFQIPKMVILTSSYDAMYYRNDQFYALERTLGVWKPILPDTHVRYIQPKLIYKPTYDFLSIKYFGLNELRALVEPFYWDNENFVEGVLKRNPTTFLGTVPTTPTTKGHFVEYTFWGDEEPNTLADGGLRVLLGRETKIELTLRNNTEAFRLVFDQRDRTFKIPENSDINSKPLEGVFGVRMATKGFLAENHKSSVRMLNRDDLINGHPIKKKHYMFLHDLLQKVKTVEPRSLHSNSKAPSSIWNGPTSVKFQLDGQVLEKSVNLDKNGHIDNQSPFRIEIPSKGHQFEIGEHTVDQIYTNDHKLWLVHRKN